MSGINWGGNIRDFPDMVLVGDLASGRRVYRREGEKTKIGDADIERTAYGFYKERLYEVQIHFRSSCNFTKLKRILFKVYGPGGQPNPFVETYHRNGKKFSMFLTYDGTSGKGAIGHAFIPI